MAIYILNKKTGITKNPKSKAEFKAMLEDLLRSGNSEDWSVVDYTPENEEAGNVVEEAAKDIFPSSFKAESDDAGILDRVRAGARDVLSYPGRLLNEKVIKPVVNSARAAAGRDDIIQGNMMRQRSVENAGDFVNAIMGVSADPLTAPSLFAPGLKIAQSLKSVPVIGKGVSYLTGKLPRVTEGLGNALTGASVGYGSTVLDPEKKVSDMTDAEIGAAVGVGVPVTIYALAKMLKLSLNAVRNMTQKQLNDFAKTTRGGGAELTDSQSANIRNFRGKDFEEVLDASESSSDLNKLHEVYGKQVDSFNGTRAGDSRASSSRSLTGRRVQTKPQAQRFTDIQSEEEAPAMQSLADAIGQYKATNAENKAAMDALNAEKKAAVNEAKDKVSEARSGLTGLRSKSSEARNESRKVNREETKAQIKEQKDRFDLGQKMGVAREGAEKRYAEGKIRSDAKNIRNDIAEETNANVKGILSTASPRSSASNTASTQARTEVKASAPSAAKDAKAAEKVAKAAEKAAEKARMEKEQELIAGAVGQERNIGKAMKEAVTEEEKQALSTLAKVEPAKRFDKSSAKVVKTDAMATAEANADEATVEAGIAKRNLEESKANLAATKARYDEDQRILKKLSDEDRLSGRINIRQKKEDLEGIAVRSRKNNYVGGKERFFVNIDDDGVVTFSGDHFTPGDKTAEFLNSLQKNMDKAIDEMLDPTRGKYRTRDKNLRMQRTGKLYGPDGNSLSLRAQKFINEIEKNLMEKQRQYNLKDVEVGGEDIIGVLRQMQQGNEDEFIDAVLSSMKWISDSERKALRSALWKEKVSKDQIGKLNGKRDSEGVSAVLDMIKKKTLESIPIKYRKKIIDYDIDKGVDKASKATVRRSVPVGALTGVRSMED